MTETICRLYATASAAEAAAADLNRRRWEGPVHLIPPPEAGDEGEHATRAALDAAQVPHDEAEIYARTMRADHAWLVAVRPLFGSAHMAGTIMGRHDPLPSPIPRPARTAAGAAEEDPAAPLSAAFGWRVLSHDPTPLSNALGLSVLSRSDAAPRRDAGELVHDPAPLSRRFGWRLLSDDPAPLSRKFGWRVLSDNPAPLSRARGWRLLSDDPAPVSRRFGWRTLSDDPAPLSRALGWPVLSSNPTPLSNWFGWRVLKR